MKDREVVRKSQESSTNSTFSTVTEKAVTLGATKLGFVAVFNKKK